MTADGAANAPAAVGEHAAEPDQDDPAVFLPLEARLKSGATRIFNISRTATQPFGFVYDDRVSTPYGNASVVGVYDGNLYFQLDGDNGVSYWSSCTTPADFHAKDIVLVGAGVASVAATTDAFPACQKTKVIDFQGQERMVVLQNFNGPCPIIALINALVLKGQIVLPNDHSTMITAADLRKHLLQFITNRNPAAFAPLNYECPDELGGKVTLAKHLRQPDTLSALHTQFLETGKVSLERMYDGIMISPFFSFPDAFEYSEDCCLFALAGCRLCHGWIAQPEDEEIATKSYDDIMAAQFHSEDDDRSAEDKEKAAAFSLRAQQFLQSTQSQLTDEGIRWLCHSAGNDEVCVLFRNNHFNTLVVHDGVPYVLVSDEGFSRTKLIVFEELTVRGGTEFYTGDFTMLEPHVLGVMQECGDCYTVAQINEVYRELGGDMVAPTTQTLVDALRQRHTHHNKPSDGVVAVVPGQQAEGPPPLEPMHGGAVAALPALETSKSVQVEQLVAMGFDRQASQEAMEVSNDISAAIEFITTREL